MDEFDGLFDWRRPFDFRLRAWQWLAGDDDMFPFEIQNDAVFAQFIRAEIRRERLAAVPMNHGVNTAARSARGDAQQPASGHISEVRGEIGNDEEVIFFGDDSRLLVVFGDGRIFIPQIHLDHFFHELIDIGQALLDLAALRPDAIVDELFFVVGQVHDSGEILAEADGINNREIQPARRGNGKQPQNDIVERADCRFVTGI